MMMMWHIVNLVVIVDMVIVNVVGQFGITTFFIPSTPYIRSVTQLSHVDNDMKRRRRSNPTKNKASNNQNKEQQVTRSMIT